MTTLGSYFGMLTPKARPGTTNKHITEIYGAPPAPLLTGSTLIGIEIEVENVHTLLEGVPDLFCWNVTTDGSLRNHGLEFVSKVLLTNQVPYALHELNRILPTTHKFTKRTSVHIHMDVTTLTFEQLKSLTLLYLIYEKALYNWVGNGREDNIFCVPTYKSTLYQRVFRLFNEPQYFGERWMKYTGFNLRAIAEKGTVEFRHLYGTSNPLIIETWISFLLCLRNAALKYKPEDLYQQIIDLDKFSAYANLTTDIFQQWRDLLFSQPTFIEDMAYCVNAVKRQLFKEKALQLIKIEKPKREVKYTDENMKKWLFGTTVNVTGTTITTNPIPTGTL